MSLNELVRRTADKLSARRKGAVVVGAVRDDVTVIHGADPGTVFEIGSITKTFTSLALARLAVRGDLALDRPLRDLLPSSEVPHRGGRDIQLVHLACHTSGLPRLPKGLMPRGVFAADPYAGCTEAMLLDGLARTRLRATPGHRFRYSNLGAGLLGLALARHREVGYDELIQEEVCRPLGLADTRVHLTAELSARLASGHSWSGRPRPGWRLGALAGAGGLHSTAPDLLRLARATFGDAPDELADAVTLTHRTGHRLRGTSTAHPGWIGFTRAGLPILFHNGGTGGYRSILAVAPDKRVAVAVLSADARSVDRAGLGLLFELVPS